MYALIDFAEPQIWLPLSACDVVARAFNLTYDNSTDLYLIDSYTRARLLERNPSITFGLGQTANPGERINVVLPYSAFDQQASYPIYANTTNYFPIRRAYNDTQYTLGRAFFQEAYVIIDYERGNFSVHQALFPMGNEQQIVPIPPKAMETIAKSGDSPISLSGKTIAGISIGSVALLIIAVFIAFWVFRRRGVTEKQRQPMVEKIWAECEDQPRLETDGAAFFEKDSLSFAEMEGHVFPALRIRESEPQELDVRITRTDLSAIFELYEMADNERGGDELDIIVSEKVCPPPGWI